MFFLITSIAVFSLSAGSVFGFMIGKTSKDTKNKHKEDAAADDSTWGLRPVLSPVAWYKFKKYIENECKGYYLAMAAIKSVLDQGYRFSCAQIYEMVDIYTGKWPHTEAGLNANEFMKKTMCYYTTLKSEAEDKVFQLISTDDEQPLLTDGV